MGQAAGSGGGPRRRVVRHVTGDATRSGPRPAPSAGDAPPRVRRVVAVHELGNGVAGGDPLAWSPKICGSQTPWIWVIAMTIALCCASRFETRVHGAGHEVAAHQVVRGRPATDPDPVVTAQRLEPRVVAHRERSCSSTWALMSTPARRLGERRQAAVVVGRAVADRAAREPGERRGCLAEPEPAPSTDLGPAAAGGGPALKAHEIGGLDRHAQAPRECGRQGTGRHAWPSSSAVRDARASGELVGVRSADRANRGRTARVAWTDDDGRAGRSRGGWGIRRRFVPRAALPSERS